MMSARISLQYTAFSSTAYRRFGGMEDWLHELLNFPSWKRAADTSKYEVSSSKRMYLGYIIYRKHILIGNTSVVKLFSV